MLPDIGGLENNAALVGLWVASHDLSVLCILL